LTLLDHMLDRRGGGRLRNTLLKTDIFAPGRTRSFWFRSIPNVGDAISPILTEAATSGPRPVWVTANFQGKLLSTGSILGALRANDSVWGSGSIDGHPIDVPPGVTFLAVRGPLTRAAIRADVPEVYGDPALLLPDCYRPATRKRFAVGIIPHYVDRVAFQRPRDPSIALIDVRHPWQEVVTRILECETIVSSSLHGIILAEAYGIPASWIQVSENITGGTFKFHDYLLATGRNPTDPTHWNDSALATCVAGPLQAPIIDLEPLRLAALQIPTR
jgi:pyruvyltransferase